METVEILHYKWCIWENPTPQANKYIVIQDGYGHSLIYCKVERYTEYEDVGNSIRERITNNGIRTVPVKREEMEKI